MSSDQTTSGSNSVYSIIKQALSGEHRDYTTGSIRRAVIFLSIPMILEMCMESVFAVVDIFFVGRIGFPQAAKLESRSLRVPLAQLVKDI